MPIKLLPIAVLLCLLTACDSSSEQYDVIIKNGTVYDGSGEPGQLTDVGIINDTIAKLGDLSNATASTIIDASGQAVAPGFINMLSWATVSLLADGRGLSDLKQGVTLEVMGEGWSMGPLTPKMKEDELNSQGDIKYDIEWNTLGEYLQYLEDKGVSMNVASYVGATTVRIHEIGYEDRSPTEEEMAKMQDLVREAMREGAIGVSSSLIYAPAFYADTEELIALSKAASEYGGSYVTHMRSEGNKLLEGVDEVLEIAEKASIKAELYHLKAGGQSNWPKMDLLIQKLDSAQKAGIDIAANMYNYVAGATGLNASMPPWVQEGGYQAWANRLKDPKIRAKVKAEMKTDAQDWENLYYSAGSADQLILVGFKNDELKKYTGKTLAEVAAIRGTDPEDTAMDLVIEDGSRVGTVYFLMSEDNVKKQLQLPYITFGSDAGALAAEGNFLKSSTHPRAYGNFSRLLGKYVRDEQIIPMEEAIYKLTKLSAQKLGIRNRGELKPGFYADVVIFDPSKVKDNATFAEPHQYAEGVNHVLVNGEQVLKDGEATDARSGRFVKGPGFGK
ncbi:MAG: D-aminoacylase [Bacteroidota bacterium]